MGMQRSAGMLSRSAWRISHSRTPNGVGGGGISRAGQHVWCIGGGVWSSVRVCVCVVYVRVCVRACKLLVDGGVGCKCTCSVNGPVRRAPAREHVQCARGMVVCACEQACGGGSLNARTGSAPSRRRGAVPPPPRARARARARRHPRCSIPQQHDHFLRPPRESSTW